MAYSPKTPYTHDGHHLHPKLSYQLPDGMGERMVDLGLFIEVDGAADVDLSAMAWDDTTVRGTQISPDEIAHDQGVGETL